MRMMEGGDAATGLSLQSTLPYPNTSGTDLPARLEALESRIYLTLYGMSEESDAIAAEAEQRCDQGSALRARLMATDVRSRSGDPSGARAEQILLHRAAQPWPALARRAAMLLATSCDRLGERTESMRWIRSAMQDWSEGDHPTWRAEALMVFALMAVTRNGGVDYTLVQHAATEVRAYCGPLLLSVTLANFAEVAAECGDLVNAAEFADSAVALLRRHPETTAALTLDSIGISRLAVGEIAAAEFALNASLQLEQELGCTDVNGDPWLTLAAVLLAKGDAAGAWAMLENDRRLRWAAKSSWTLSRDLKLRARVLAALGRWQEAYGALLTHIDVYETVRSLDGDRAVAENETLQAVDEERRRSRQFEQLALTDPLTGLPNRRQVDRWLREAAEDASGNEPGASRVAVAILDLDHFKRVNDTYSHDTGDLVLRGVATTLLDSCPRAGDARPALVARLGGEEFVIVWPVISPAEATAEAERILARVRDTTFVEAAHIRVTASMGLAHGVPSGVGSNLLKAADTCLYAAKDLGRDRCVSIEGVPG